MLKKVCINERQKNGLHSHVLLAIVSVACSILFTLSRARWVSRIMPSGNANLSRILVLIRLTTSIISSDELESGE